ADRQGGGDPGRDLQRPRVGDSRRRRPGVRLSRGRGALHPPPSAGGRPVLTAKEASPLDVISNGRVSVTVAVGGRENDYRAVGAPFTHRHQRMDDQVAEMKKVWRGEPLW